jgi:8-oxo-dGTP pyrophosphatase MutT (NUDIX family)
MRELIEARLADYAAPKTAAAALLANVEGPISAQLRRALAAPGARAAVLLPLIERPRGLTVLMTERAHHLSQHAGQVAFPGGRLEHPDEPVVEAALREAHEEVGLAAADVAVAGQLAEFATGTGFSVTPIVGFVSGSFVPRANPAEVERVFEVPLDFVLEAENCVTSYRERFGSRFRTYELRYENFLIWGATAAMLMDFRNLILDK